MHILILIIGFIMGIILNGIIQSISYRITKDRTGIVKIFAPFVCSFAYEILFLKFGFGLIFVKAVLMTSVLITISYIDLLYKIIPDYMVGITLFIGIIFSFLIKASMIDTLLGMLLGGGTLFMLSLVPNAMGGGDVKLMFAVGSFLGLHRTLWAIFLAFVVSSIISIVLILFKIKGTKDFIPFGPFLSLGSFISLILF